MVQDLSWYEGSFCGTPEDACLKAVRAVYAESVELAFHEELTGIPALADHFALHALLVDCPSVVWAGAETRLKSEVQRADMLWNYVAPWGAERGSGAVRRLFEELREQLRAQQP